MHLLIEGALKNRGLSKFVFTCRPRLNYENSSFLQIELHGLSIEETRQLFKTRGVDVDIKHIDEVQELTQGHPLWLNLIATQILTNRVEIQEFIARIKSGKVSGLPNATLQEIWRTLKPKHQTLLRYLAEMVHPETESHLGQFVSGELNHNQFTKCLKQLRSLDLVVVKSPVSGPDTIELHPLIREFVRRQFSHSERYQYILAIVVFLDRYIAKYWPGLASEVSYGVLQNWTTKAELLINGGEYIKALQVLEEARRSLLQNGYSEEFVKLAATLFENLEWNEALINNSKTYDDVYEDFMDTLTTLGRFAEAEKFIKKFEDTVSGATPRRIAVCNMRTFLYWTQEKYDLAKEWGRRGVQFKSKNQLDTRHDCEHTLALARRDSGEVDEALSYFLFGNELETVLNPKEIISNRGGSFYGNIGRCLFFKGDYASAKICLIKSAFLLEKERHQIVLVNRGWAALWLGELFEKQEDYKITSICYKMAIIKWKSVSPQRAEKAEDALNRISKKYNNELKDWEIERAYTDWLNSTATLGSAS
jgi:tetratricopeptide (TPR) repeat protein